MNFSMFEAEGESTDSTRGHHREEILTEYSAVVESNVRNDRGQCARRESGQEGRILNRGREKGRRSGRKTKEKDDYDDGSSHVSHMASRFRLAASYTINNTLLSFTSPHGDNLGRYAIYAPYGFTCLSDHAG